MAGYNYSKFVSDFGTRTLANQGKIDKLKENDRNNGMSEDELKKNHHEVTQLINSLFGLLIIPYEKYKYNPDDPNSSNSMREADLKKTKEYFWIAKKIIYLENHDRLYNDYDDHFLVGAFIRHLRNSLAHSGDEGLQFMPIEEKQEVERIIFRDHDETHQFCVELSVGDVRLLTERLSAMYKKLEHLKEINDLPVYKEKYKRYSDLMKSPDKPKWARSFKEKINQQEKQPQTNLL